MVEIKGFVDISLTDWDGMVSCVIFLPRCNFRCPFCYNVELVLRPNDLPSIPLKQIERYLRKQRGWIDGVVISGGEPTIHHDLPDLCSKIKHLGFKVKLDTNGMSPGMVASLIEEEVVDYVAMDIKAPLEEKAYSKLTGIDAGPILDNVKRSIELLMKSSIEYEFRTTVVPTLHSRGDVRRICEEIRGCKKYVLQSFKSGVNYIDPKLKEVKPFSEEEMQEYLREARSVVPNSIVRGYPSLLK